MYEVEEEKLLKLLKKLEQETNIELQKLYQECVEKQKRLGFSREVCKNEVIDKYYRVTDTTNDVYLKMYLNEKINKCLQNCYFRDNKLEICKENA